MSEPPKPQIHAAAADGDETRVAACLKQGAHPDSTFDMGRTPMMLAAENGHLGVVQLLWRHGANVNAETSGGWTAVIEAVRLEDHTVSLWLAKQGADIHFENIDGATALDLMEEDHGDEAAAALENAFESGKRWRRRLQLLAVRAALRHRRRGTVDQSDAGAQ